MKRLILLTGAVIYLFLMLICFAANAQQANANAPLIHIHTVKDFKGKVSVKDTSFRMDSARMHAMMHKKSHRSGKDSLAHKHPKMGSDSAMAHHKMNMKRGNRQAWAGQHRYFMKNIDSISIQRRFTVRGDSMVRDTRRITYFKSSPGNNIKTADTVIKKDITVHKGIRPKDIPDGNDPNLLNQDLNGGGNQTPTQGNLKLTNLNISPNPSSGQFRIAFSATDLNPVELKITDMEGKPVWQDADGNFNGQYDRSIDLSAQPKAVYILEIMQNSKTMLKKLVVN